MAGAFSRRRFIQIALGGAGGIFLGSSLLPRGRAGASAGQGEPSRMVPTFCEVCFWKCGARACVEQGRVVKLEGNPLDPVARGRLCPRGNGGMSLVDDPDRIRRPLVRIQARGRDAFRESSWDEALDTIAEKMKAIIGSHGPESIALFGHGSGVSWFRHLFKSFGSPNFASPAAAQCRGAREAAFELTFGEGLGSPEPLDVPNARCLVLIGSHLGENMHNSAVADFAEAVENDAHIIVVDPRFSVAASKARHWLPIKAGTDMALLLAWMHVIIGEGLFDREYVERYTEGFEKLAAHVGGTTPEWAYPITGIAPDLVRETARALGRCRPSTIVHPGRHVSWYGDDTQRVRAIAILNALLGSYGRPGGFYFPEKYGVPKYPYPPYPKSGKGRADGAGTLYPFASADEGVTTGLRDATLSGKPYPVKGWFVYGTNLLQSIPDGAATRRALEKLDLVVVIDPMPSETAGWADVVLPECTYLERYDDLAEPFYRVPFVSLRQPAVEPVGESKAGWWIARELGLKLGLQRFFPWADAEEYLAARLKSAGLSFDELKKKGTVTKGHDRLFLAEGAPHRFPTESGKIQLYGAALEEKGFAPLPVYTPFEEPPAGYFRLLSGRSPLHTFGRTVNSRLLGGLYRENELWLNRQIARGLGVRDGDRVVLKNQDGLKSGPVKVKVTARVRPDVVYMVHGFGRSARGLTRAFGKGASDNDLMSRYAVDPLMGGTGSNMNFVTLEAPSSSTGAAGGE